MPKKTIAQPPEKFTGIKETKIPESAVGFKAVLSALTHIKEEVGIMKGIHDTSLAAAKEYGSPGNYMARSEGVV